VRECCVVLRVYSSVAVGLLSAVGKFVRQIEAIASARLHAFSI